MLRPAFALPVAWEERAIADPALPAGLAQLATEVAELLGIRDFAPVLALPDAPDLSGLVVDPQPAWAYVAAGLLLAEGGARTRPELLAVSGFDPDAGPTGLTELPELFRLAQELGTETLFVPPGDVAIVASLAGRTALGPRVEMLGPSLDPREALAPVLAAHGASRPRPRPVAAPARPGIPTTRELLKPLRPRLLRVEAAADEPVWFGDDPGSLFRSAFGAAFRHAACARESACRAACEQPKECLYSFAFETPTGRDGESPRHRPHPMLLRVERARAVVEPGETFTVEAVLLGPMGEFAPQVLAAIEIAGDRGLGTNRARYSVAGAEVHDPLAELPAPPPDPRELVVDFVSRTRITGRGRVLRTLAFESLVRAILRRTIDLAEAFGGGRPDFEPRDVVARARDVRTVRHDLVFADSHRWSARQEREVPEGGVVGRVVYGGPVGEFAGLVAAGELLHVGKGTMLGHGRFRARFR